MGPFGGRSSVLDSHASSENFYGGSLMVGVLGCAHALLHDLWKRTSR